MNITFLGTACMVPTKERNHQSLFIEHGREGIMIDCGEGTQRQIKIAGIRPSKISRILISHWHGDHVLGLPGLLQTLNKSEYDRTLHIYLPKGTKKFLDLIYQAFDFQNEIDLEVIEFTEGKVFETAAVKINAYALEHTIPSFGFRLMEQPKRKIIKKAVTDLGIPDGPLLGKLQDNEPVEWEGKTIRPDEVTKVVNGKVIGIIADTVICDGCQTIAENADLLISESVYHSDQKEKAKQFMHLTSEEAALLASQNNVKKLILTHFSQRYKVMDKLLEEARDLFPETDVSYDLMKVKI